MRTIVKSRRFYTSFALLIALLAASPILINAPKTDASEQGQLNDRSGTQTGTPKTYLGPCWGIIEAPHNSSGNNPGPNYIQAKTQIRCNDILSNIGTASVTNWLYVRADSSHRWELLASNTARCNAATVTNEVNGWVQCRPASSGRFPVMVAGLKSPCIKGTTYDYKQSVYGNVTTDGGTYSGWASKIKNDVLCKGT